MDKFEKYFNVYSHQEASITDRTNLMLVAQSFLVVGFIEASSNWLLQLALSILGIVVTLFTIYVGMREKCFFMMVRNELKKMEENLVKDEQIFNRVDEELDKKWWVKLFFKWRASSVLCYHLQICFGIFWILCFFLSIAN